MTLKLVLVNPPLTTEERYGVHFRSGGQTPPLGLACLAAVTVSHGIDTRIVDGAVIGGLKETVREIMSNKPDVVGLTASTVSVYNSDKVAQVVKAIDSHIVTLIGGPHVTAAPVETMRAFLDFDIGVVGEAEETIIELLGVIQSKSNLQSVNGLAFRTNSSIVLTERRPYIRNLDSLPMPAWDLLPSLSKAYCPPVHTVRQLPAALLVTSRGCPGHCTFCDRSVFGNDARAYSAQYVLKMMRHLHDECGIKEFQFRDDNFLTFKQRTIELCELIKESGLSVTWSLAGRVDMINPETLKMLKNAGCWQIWYGVESGSQRVLDFIQKHTRLDGIRRAVRWTKDAGIDVGGFFMLGLPTETKRDIEATIRFSQELELDEAHFCLFTPFPGCELCNVASQHGSFDRDWRKANCWNPVFVPHMLTEKQLVKYWKQASTRFYLRPRIMWSYLHRAKSIRHLKVYLSGLLALLEAVFVKKYETERD